MDITHFNWHYYPQQSRRGPIVVRRAFPGRLLEPAHLDEIVHWADEIRSYRDRYGPGKPIWLGETGNAQFGGEPGVSDRFIGGLWWLDQLGLLAIHHHDVVVRQTLVGMDYGLLDPGTLAPRPDFWASVLFKRLMGRRVLAAQRTASATAYERKVRLYAHCTRAAAPEGGVTILALNLNHDRSVQVNSELSRAGARVFLAQAPDVLGKQVRMNGRLLTPSDADRIPTFTGSPVGSQGPLVSLPPLTYAFVTLPAAGASACAAE